MSTDKDESQPITGKDILDALRGSDEPAVLAALEQGNVEMAESKQATVLQPWVDRILTANGIKSAWVSDRSTMGDFIPHGDREARRREVAVLLGMDFNLGDPVVDVARRLRALEASVKLIN
ncbi:hypothetical protein N9917_00755 [Deltaproteobacteria bacterium]|nr:hypothetical protein [Deltaproteobacteria bacterium]